MIATFLAAGILVVWTGVTWAEPPAETGKLRPVIEGEWWQVAANPDLGPWTSEDQEPVDFAIWQAADGAWQLWSCIRGTKHPGFTRVFYAWEGRRRNRRMTHIGRPAIRTGT